MFNVDGRGKISVGIHLYLCPVIITSHKNLIIWICMQIVIDNCVTAITHRVAHRHFTTQYGRSRSFPYLGEDDAAQWLTPGSPAHKVLTNRIRKPHFLSQLKLAAHGQQTWMLEVLHTLMLSYVTKQIDNDPPSYHARIQLAICDHNENCDRPIIAG